MTSKEATVYIIDVSSSMGERNGGRDESDLEWAMRYIWDKLTTTVATDRKTALMSVIALGSDHTNNDMCSDANRNSSENDDAYKHISVLKRLAQMQMPALRDLREAIHPANHCPGADVMSAIVLAIQLISEQCRQLKYIRKIILVTNAKAPMDADDMHMITSKVKEDGIELLILGVDFDDPEYGYKELNKDPTKAENEKTLKEITDACNGVCGTLAQAIEELSIPRIKSVRPVHSYKGWLSLGDPEKYDTAMTIDIERYPRTMVARPPTASNFVIRSDMAPGEATQAEPLLHDIEQNGLAAVKNARDYHVPDPNEPGGKREVAQDMLAKGYAYGSTAVYISESDRNVTTYETKPGLEIIGFVAKEDYHRYMDMSRTNVIVAQRTNDKANLALSSLIHALSELNSYAVARLVAKQDKAPVLLLLAPSIEVDLECLYDVELPFREDVRSYRFPPLDAITTVSGKTLTQHRNLPSRDLMSAMSDYVDAMDLSTLARDDDNKPTEYMTIDETFSPVLHRVNQVIRHRAVNPNSDVPPIPEILTKHSHPPSSLVDSTKAQIDRLKTAADVKKFPPKVRSKRGRRAGTDANKPLSGLDVDALLDKQSTQVRSTKSISRENAIPEFKQALERASSLQEINDTCNQLAEIIRDKIRHSVGDSGYGVALAAIKVMRDEMTDLENAEVYNGFMKALKRELLGGQLGGDRLEMWYLVRKEKVGLILDRDVPGGEASEEFATRFLSSRDV